MQQVSASPVDLCLVHTSIWYNIFQTVASVFLSVLRLCMAEGVAALLT